MKKIVFDIDGTICEESPTFERFMAKPRVEYINMVNECYSEGHFVMLYTARTWSEYKMTEEWLRLNNVKYHILLCGKPVYDLWVDDRAINAKIDHKVIQEKIKNG